MQKVARQFGLAPALLAGALLVGLAGCAKPAPAGVQSPNYSQQPQIQQTVSASLQEAGQLAGLARAAAASGDAARVVELLNQMKASISGSARVTSADGERMAALSGQIDAAIAQINGANVNRQEVANIATSQIVNSINYLGTH